MSVNRRGVQKKKKQKKVRIKNYCLGELKYKKGIHKASQLCDILFFTRFHVGRTGKFVCDIIYQKYSLFSINRCAFRSIRGNSKDDKKENGNNNNHFCSLFSTA